MVRGRPRPRRGYAHADFCIAKPSIIVFFCSCVNLPKSFESVMKSEAVITDGLGYFRVFVTKLTLNQNNLTSILRYKYLFYCYFFVAYDIESGRKSCGSFVFVDAGAESDARKAVDIDGAVGLIAVG